MPRATKEFPTYEFANDPLPPRTKPPRRQAEGAAAGFRPTETVRLGDLELEVTQRVDGSTPWRETGDTDFDHFLGAISRAHPPAAQSPLVAEARAMYDVLRAAGLSRFAAAMLWHEKKNDTWADSPIPVHFRNPFSTKDRSRPGEWERFDTYAGATRAWVTRVSTPPYPQNATIAEFVHIYAPAADDNDEARYVTVLTNGINELPIEHALPPPPKGKPITIAGLPNPVFVPTDFPFEMILTPRGPNRPGHPMTPQGITQHETDNERAGEGARGHSRWQDNGTPGHPNPPVGVHFYVDDTVVIQKIPVDETSIHAASPGNETHISVELCVNRDRNVQRAERNAMVLAAALLRDGLGRGADVLKMHNDWWPNNPCPRILRREHRWESFKQTVGDLIAEVQGQPASFPGLPPEMPAEVFLALFPQANPDGPVTRFYIDYCVNHMPPGQWPRLNGSRTLGDGTTWWDFNPLHIFSNRDGKVWIAGGAAPRPMPETSATVTEPPRDFMEKEAAAERDRDRRRARTTSETKLFSAPRGDVLRTLPKGARLTVLGKAEDRFFPVSVREGEPSRGFVRENAIARDQTGGDRDGDGDGPANGSTSTDGSTGGNGAPAAAGRRIAAEARRYVGRPYVFATHGPDTFDCSGLVHWVVLQATDKNISPDSHAQFNLGAPVDWDLLRPGDIVFYDTQNGQEVREGNSASHVGIFISDGRMINALNEDAGVREDNPFSDYFKPKYLGARRLA